MTVRLAAVIVAAAVAQLALAAPRPSAQMLVEADLAFAARAAAGGTRAAFLAFMADSAVALRPEPPLARA